MINVTDRWRTIYPDAHAGVLLMSAVANPQKSEDLERQKRELEGDLRDRFSGKDRGFLNALPVVQAYNDFYKAYKKTYHLFLQLESVVLKDKPIPRTASLVEAMFMAELKNLILTAGHDGDVLQFPIRVDVATGLEQYTRINGREQKLKEGDMFMADQGGVISSVIYGPDRRTRIKKDTRKALFAAYAPAGIETSIVRKHLIDIESNVKLITPQAKTDFLEVLGSE